MFINQNLLLYKSKICNSLETIATRLKYQYIQYEIIKIHHIKYEYLKNIKDVIEKKYIYISPTLKSKLIIIIV